MGILEGPIEHSVNKVVDVGALFSDVYFLEIPLNQKILVALDLTVQV